MFMVFMIWPLVTKSRISCYGKIYILLLIFFSLCQVDNMQMPCENRYRHLPTSPVQRRFGPKGTGVWAMKSLGRHCWQNCPTVNCPEWNK